MNIDITLTTVMISKDSLLALTGWIIIWNLINVALASVAMCVSIGSDD